MAEKQTVRNICLCIKGCFCLYVCLTGAVSRVPKEYPKQLDKKEPVINAFKGLTVQQDRAGRIASKLPGGRLAVVIKKSNQIMAEDLIREAGCMLPKSENSYEFLQDFLTLDQPGGFPESSTKNLWGSFLAKGEEESIAENRTQQSLMAAFLGEAEANQKYTAYAKKLKKLDISMRANCFEGSLMLKPSLP